MKQGRENSAKEAAIQEKLESLLAGDRPFEARETLKRLEKSGADEKVVRDWKARLDRAIETLFPVKTTTKKSGLIKSLAGGEKGLQILPSGGDWLVVGSQAVGIISSTLADSGVAYGLPASVAELEGTRYFVRGEEGAFQLVCWNHDTGRLAWLSLDEGRLVPRSVVTVNSDLLDQSNVTEFPKSVAVDWDSQSFLMVEMSERNARKESALHRICPIRGRVVQTERFSAGLHHMEPMWGTDSLLISRAFEPTQRMLPGWFHGGMLERKGRLQERWFLDDLEFEIHTIRAASLSSTSNRVYGQYWYLDPFSGRAAGGGQALFVLKDDRSLFFQTRDPKMFLEGARTMSGPLRLVLAEEGDRLLMPWSDDKKGSGIAVIDGASMRLLGDLTFSSGWTVQEIGVSDCQNQAVALLSDGAGGWALESIHPEKAILPSS